MKKLLLVLFLFGVVSASAQTNLFNIQYIGSKNFNQAVGKGLQVTDTAILKKVTILDSLRGNGVGLVGIDNTGKLFWTDTVIGGIVYVDSLWGNITQDTIYWLKNGMTYAIPLGGGGGSGVDSLWRTVGIDSIYYSIGANTYAILDSAGGSGGVDSIWRTAGIDSIYYSIGGNTYAIRDSSGSGYAIDSMAWHLLGNAGTIVDTNFVGTTDSTSLMFKINNTRAGVIDINGGRTALGQYAMDRTPLTGATKTTSGTAVGYAALRHDSLGLANVAVGNSALRLHGMGNNNTSVGTQSMFNQTLGTGNTAIGANSAYSIDGADFITAIGYNTLSNGSGNNNTVVGAYAGYVITSGANNVMMGKNTGSVRPTTGDGNTLLGYNVNTAANATNYAIGLGYQAAPSSNQFAVSDQITSYYFKNLPASNNADDSMIVKDQSSGLWGYRAIPARTDTTSLSNRINLKIDSIRRTTGTDSVFAYANGIKTFSFIDSTGGGDGVDTIYRTLGKDSIQFTIGGTYYAIKDSVGVTDTTSLSNRINHKVDTIWRQLGKDSIYFKINGTTYQIKDSSNAWATDSMAWHKTGDAGTSGSNFIGTTDAQNWYAKVRNVTVAQFTHDIGTNIGSYYSVADNVYRNVYIQPASKTLQITGRDVDLWGADTGNPIRLNFQSGVDHTKKVSIEAMDTMKASYAIYLPDTAPAPNTVLKYISDSNYVWSALNQYATDSMAIHWVGDSLKNNTTMSIFNKGGGNLNIGEAADTTALKTSQSRLTFTSWGDNTLSSADKLTIATPAASSTNHTVFYSWNHYFQGHRMTLSGFESDDRRDTLKFISPTSPYPAYWTDARSVNLLAPDTILGSSYTITFPDTTPKTNTFLKHTTGGVYVWDTVRNAGFATDTLAWEITGNSNTSGTNFLGTKNNQSVRIKTNDTTRVFVDSTGRVGIGSYAPSTVFEVHSTGQNDWNSDAEHIVFRTDTARNYINMRTAAQNYIWGMNDGGFGGAGASPFFILNKATSRFPILIEAGADGYGRTALGSAVTTAHRLNIRGISPNGVQLGLRSDDIGGKTWSIGVQGTGSTQGVPGVMSFVYDGLSTAGPMVMFDSLGMIVGRMPYNSPTQKPNAVLQARNYFRTDTLLVIEDSARFGALKVYGDRTIALPTLAVGSSGDSSVVWNPTTKTLGYYVKPGGGGGGGSGTVTSVDNGWGISVSPDPITTTGSVIADSATLSGYYLRSADTASISNRINLKLNISDTASMLSNRFARDTISLSNRIDLKLNISDTSTMLSNRFARDTVSLSNRINLKLNIADTSTMLSNRFARDTVSLSNRIDTKLNLTDTSSMLSNYRNKVDTIWRTFGKDSIQFYINGRYHAIKDSSGGGGATDTMSLSNRINNAYDSIVQINDTTFALTTPNGRIDTIQFTGGGGGGGSFDSLHCYTKLFIDSIIGCSPLYIGAEQTNFSGDINLKYDTSVIKLNDAILVNTFGNGSNLRVGIDAMGTVGGWNPLLAEDNTSIGYSAGRNITTGVNNVFVGSVAGDQVTDGVCNTMIGYEAMDLPNGSWNTGMGTYSGPTNSIDYTNTFGYRAKAVIPSTTIIGMAYETALGVEANPAAYTKTGIGTNRPWAKLHVRTLTTDTFPAFVVKGASIDSGKVTITDTLLLTGLGATVSDTSTFKPLVINSSGQVEKLYNWPAGGGGGGSMSYADSVAFHGNANITTLGTIATGTWNATAIDSTYLANTVNKLVAGTNITLTQHGTSGTWKIDATGGSGAMTHQQIMDTLNSLSASNDFTRRVKFDSVINVKSIILQVQSIATAAGTTTLTAASPFQTIFTGSTTQNCDLPDATTLLNGHRFKISNNSTGLVTVRTNGGATFWILGASTDIEMALTDNGTAAGTWEKDYRVGNAATGKVMTVNNSITLTGTDATTMTFPTTSATLARTDAANTFTGASSATSWTLTTPVISSITNTGTLTLPTVTSTIMGYKEATITTNDTLSPVGDARENYLDVTAVAEAVTVIQNPSGSAANHNTLLIRIKDNATARAISGWGSQYRAGTNLAFPTTTTLSKTMYIKFIFNSTDTKWDLVSVIDGL